MNDCCLLHNPCLAWTAHGSSGDNTSPMPTHPPVQKGQCDSHCAELQLHWCTWLQAVGCERCFSPPSHASLLLGVRTSEKNRMVRTDRREVWTQDKDATLPPATAKLALSKITIDISPESQTKIRKDAERGWEYVLNGSFPKQCPQCYCNCFYYHSLMSHLTKG